MKPSTVWKRMLKLKNMQNLNIESDSQYSIISIENWDAYQNYSAEKVTTKGTTKEQPRNTNKNVENVKNKDISIIIYEFYIEKVNPLNKTRTRALKNISFYLGEHSFQDLQSSIVNYASVAQNRQPQYRKDPANFFGRQEPTFKDFLPGSFMSGTETGVKEEIESFPKTCSECGSPGLIDVETGLCRACYSGLPPEEVQQKLNKIIAQAGG